MRSVGELPRGRFAVTHPSEPGAYVPGASYDLVGVIGDDRYDAGRLIGQGRRGPSVQARRRSDGAAVVIKIAASPARSPDRRAFLGAADRRFALDHAGLVHALDRGVAPDGRPWLVCPFHPGGSLGDRDGVLPVDRLQALAQDAAAALGVLHDSGLVHANLVPGNLLVRPGDDGVAIDGSTLPGLAPVLADGLALSHVPPEVLEGGPWASAGDVWALASCLHTLLRGGPPWAEALRGGAVQLLLAMSTEPPARTRRADVPAWLDTLLADCLAGDGAARPSAHQLLERLRQGSGPTRAATEIRPSPAGAPGPEGRPLGSSYVLLEPVGSGTTGQVWRAERRFDGRPLAVKLLRPELTSSPEAIARFLRERTTLVGLTHPNLVTVLDMVAEGSTLGIVMELVDGRDLRAVLTDRGRLGVAEACRLISQIGSGVAAMHQAGIVHRDLKPENVLLAGTVAKVTDFGIARALEGPSVTRTEQLVGTAEYLAPELVAGRPLTPAVDVYSLGVVLYEAVCGHRPFEGEHPAAVLRAHLDSEPERPPSLPDPLWGLILRMMAKDPAVRPGAAEVSTYTSELADWIDGTGSTALPVLGPSASLVAAGPVLAPRPTPAPGETSEALGALRLDHPPAVDEPVVSSRRRRRPIMAVGIAVLVLAAAGTGVGLALNSGHRKAKPTYGADVTTSVTVASNGTVTVRWKPVSVRDFELLLISVRAGTTGTPQPTVVSNSAGEYQLAGVAPGLHCFQALAYFTGPPPAALTSPNNTKECLTVP